MIPHLQEVFPITLTGIFWVGPRKGMKLFILKVQSYLHKYAFPHIHSMSLVFSGRQKKTDLRSCNQDQYSQVSLLQVPALGGLFGA